MDKVLLTLCLLSSLALADYSDPPARTDDNLIVGTYNIKFLGSTWHDYDKLDLVISKFDVMAIQEVKDEKTLRQLTDRVEKIDGEDWGYVFGVRTHRPSGTYHEAFGVIFRRDRAQLGDGVISNVWDRQETYRNDPMFVSFVAGDFDFTLLQVHTRWTDDAEGSRKNEAAALVRHVEFLLGTLEEDDVILLGDFNYSGTKGEMKPLSIPHSDKSRAIYQSERIENAVVEIHKLREMNRKALAGIGGLNELRSYFESELDQEIQKLTHLKSDLNDLAIGHWRHTAVSIQRSKSTLHDAIGVASIIEKLLRLAKNALSGL